MMFFEPDRFEAQLFAINSFLKSLFKVRAAFGGDESKFHISVPICEVDVAGAGPIGREEYLPAVRRKRRMWVAALIVAKRIRVVTTKHIEYLPAFTQMHFGDATRTCLTISDHRVSVGVQVVMCIRAT